jgi:hypothetical protein
VKYLSESLDLRLPITYISTTIFLDGETTELLQTLQYMSYVIDIPHNSFRDKKELSVALYQTEYHLLSTEHEREESPEYLSTQTSPLSQAFSIAAFLYLQLVIRELPTMSKVHHRLVSRLQRLLEDTMWDEFRGLPYLDVLLWIVFIASTASSSLPMREYFISIQTAIDPEIQYQTKDVLRERLKRIVWRNRVCDGLLNWIWNEMRSHPTQY